MKQILLIISILIVCDLLLSECANPMSPQGGPKDTIPPTLISSVPISGSTNFKSQTVTLEFSEYVNADKLTQNLIITPKIDNKFKHVIKKNILTIKFEDPFPDSTTYSLNFFDGVTDITEKSPAVNLIVAFSTGPTIDSAKVSGHIRDLLTQEHAPNYLVGLYPETDTLDFLSENPLYFTTTSDSGEFNISYIKAGTYRILAFDDDNRNLTFDPEEEKHGFLGEVLTVGDSLGPLEIDTYLQNVKPLQLINHRSLGSYYEIRFNKMLDTYSISLDSIYSHIVGEKKNIIRVYNDGQFNDGDSIPIILSAMDTLSNQTQDTLKLVFSESKRRKPEFTYSIAYNNDILIDSPTYQLSFSKPIVTTDPTKFQYSADSTFSVISEPIAFEWDYTRTKLSLRTNIISDSIYSAYEDLLPKDSILIDSILTPPPSPSPLSFEILTGAFITVESDTNQISSITHQKSVKRKFGTLKLQINTERTSYTTQLLENGQVKYQSRNESSPTFLVAPSTYTVRILIDSNLDGDWSFGNLLQNIPPEEVYLFDQPISVRENWIVEDILITF